MRTLLALIGMFTILACSGVPSREIFNFPLQKQILMPRPGHEGKLTYKTCTTLDEKGNCTVSEIKEYDLKDPVVRTTLIKGSFSCLISGELYQICGDQPGFCKQTFTQKCFLFFCGQKEKHVDYIPIDNYQFLINAGTVCAADSECDVLNGDC